MTLWSEDSTQWDRIKALALTDLMPRVRTLSGRWGAKFTVAMDQDVSGNTIIFTGKIQFGDESKEKFGPWHLSASLEPKVISEHVFLLFENFLMDKIIDMEEE